MEPSAGRHHVQQLASERLHDLDTRPRFGQLELAERRVTNIRGGPPAFWKLELQVLEVKWAYWSLWSVSCCVGADKSVVDSQVEGQVFVISPVT